MSWALLVPVVDKIIDAGIEYCKSDSTATQNQAATREEVTTQEESEAVTILLVANYSGSSEDLEANIRQALSLVDNLTINELEIKIGP